MGQAIAAIDMCVVPTLTFERLFAFLVLGHGRRQLLWFEVIHSGVAGSTDHRSLPLGIGADLSGARQWRCIRTGLPRGVMAMEGLGGALGTRAFLAAVRERIAPFVC